MELIEVEMAHAQPLQACATPRQNVPSRLPWPFLRVAHRAKYFRGDDNVIARHADALERAAQHFLAEPVARRCW